MARLNEPSVTADGIDLLRRRFIRQNREIARVNSNQSLRIRSLENECARLLSENLDLRGQILRLEKEVEDNSAQRIADHALEIKEKMEAQLLEWGFLLAGLGVEPPAKRRVPEGRRISKSRPSRSPPQRKLRDLAKDAEALAAQEGRLPPIYENKSYPRATMNSEEILALCSEAEDADSPDLGPPPVSRFVEEDPVKVDSPTKSTGEPDIPSDLPQDALPETDDQSTPVLALDVPPKSSKEVEDPKKKVKDRGKPFAEVAEEKENPPPPNLIPNSSRVGAKRKYGDENDAPIVSEGKERLSKSVISNASSSQDLCKTRTIKDLPAARRHAKGKLTTGGSLGTRKPLGAKSTNDDVSSPKKGSKNTDKDNVKAEKAESLREASSRENMKAKRPAQPIEIPPPLLAPPPEISSLPEPENSLLDTPVIAPDTPVRSTQRDAARDTPPPTDISSNGEMSRPGRRARAAISYAEPNLRDKMRRPTKQLVDAVTGEGKYVHRPGSHKGDEFGAPPSTAKSTAGMESSENFRTLQAAEAVAKESARRESVVSPLAQREPPSEPSSVGMGKMEKLLLAETTKCPATTEGRNAKKNAPSDDAGDKPRLESTTASDGSFGDIYDFTTSSPISEAKDIDDGCIKESKQDTSRPSSRSSRRSGVALQDKSTSRAAEVQEKARSTSSRKRSSMAAPKRAFVAAEDEGAEGSTLAQQRDTTGMSAKDRVSRRRSMML